MRGEPRQIGMGGNTRRMAQQLRDRHAPARLWKFGYVLRQRITRAKLSKLDETKYGGRGELLRERRDPKDVARAQRAPVGDVGPAVCFRNQHPVAPSHM